MPATQEHSKSERWFCEHWCRLTASKCLGAFKVEKLVSESQPNAAIEANKFIANQSWGLGSDHFQTYWMCYGLESEPKAILKCEIATTTRVSTAGFRVNPEFPFLGCTPDGLVGNDTVVEIKALKIFKQYSVEKVTCKNSPVPRNVLGRQCFKVEDWNCVLKHTHAYYYQCQHILLATGRKCCDLILYAATGPDSVERIPRDEPLIKKILCFLTALWMLVIAPEVFEMRAPRNLLPFVLAEPSKSLHSSKQSPLESPDCGVNTWRPYHMYFFFWVCRTICSPRMHTSRAYTAKKKLMLQRLYSRLPVLFPVLVKVLLNKARSWLSFLWVDWQVLGYHLPILVPWIIGWWFFRLWPNHTRWSSVTFQSQLT